MFYVIHIGLASHDDPTILGMYDNEVEARTFVTDYVRDHGEEHCLRVARVI